MTNKRLTDNQIVMLMERCYKKEESIVVTQFNSDDTKTEITVDDILGIIYRQNAEIKTLQERNVILRGAVDSQKAEIEKLQADKEALIAGQETLQAHISNQNKEISRLTLLAKLGEKRADDYRAMRDRALKAEAEIEKLKEASEEAVSCFHRMENLYNIKRMELKVAKAEATKEFAELLVEEKLAVVFLKGKTDEYTEGYHDALCFVEEQIDNLVKEKVGK